MSVKAFGSKADSRWIGCNTGRDPDRGVFQDSVSKPESMFEDDMVSDKAEALAISSKSLLERLICFGILESSRYSENEIPKGSKAKFLFRLGTERVCADGGRGESGYMNWLETKGTVVGGSSGAVSYWSSAKTSIKSKEREASASASGSSKTCCSSEAIFELFLLERVVWIGLSKNGGPTCSGATKAELLTRLSRNSSRRFFLFPETCFSMIG